MRLESILVWSAIAAIIGSYPAFGADGQRSFVVIGEGQSTVVPDLVHVVLGISTQADTASEALQTNSQKAEDIISKLQQDKVDWRDIQTVNLQLEPRYASSPGLDARSGRLLGYTASSSIHLKVRDISRLGTLIDGAVNKGAVAVGGIRFDIADPATALNAAREHAFDDARQRAELYAKRAGHPLGPLISLSEEGPSPTREYGGGASDALAAPLAPGELTLRVRIRASYGITQ
ncbi:SIMPL domain-containing protein [Microvirga sp. HBU67558]|uniref:SIMPL domain-containing protein n=1 Tax=Microvirga TaxID=186650 RepID=UPI001B394F89|nr:MULTISPECIES: SIMPL domain-containing protein [unclassified Microvirga]MBQ0822681.1 SIMPL domain-containing protein [Microvirga sp. HBU67558]